MERERERAVAVQGGAWQSTKAAAALATAIYSSAGVMEAIRYPEYNWRGVLVTGHSSHPTKSSLGGLEGPLSFLLKKRYMKHP